MKIVISVHTSVVLALPNACIDLGRLYMVFAHSMSLSLVMFEAGAEVVFILRKLSKDKL